MFQKSKIVQLARTCKLSNIILNDLEKVNTLNAEVKNAYSCSSPFWVFYICILKTTT